MAELEVGPVLKAVRRTASPLELADLLQKHLGGAPNAAYCREAFEAVLARRADDSARKLAETILLLCGGDWCCATATLITALRAQDSTTNGT